MVSIFSSKDILELAGTTPNAAVARYNLPADPIALNLDILSKPNPASATLKVSELPDAGTKSGPSKGGQSRG